MALVELVAVVAALVEFVAVVAVVAFPVKAAVIVPAAKFPDPSLNTTEEAVLAFVQTTSEGVALAPDIFPLTVPTDVLELVIAARLAFDMAADPLK